MRTNPIYYWILPVLATLASLQAGCIEFSPLPERLDYLQDSEPDASAMSDTEDNIRFDAGMDASESPKSPEDPTFQIILPFTPDSHRFQ